MDLSRRVFLTSTAGLALSPWITFDAFAQTPARANADPKLPPVPPDLPVDGPRFLKNGPMIGHVTEDRAFVWIKASNSAKVTLRVGTSPDLAEARVIDGPALTSETAFAASLEITGLQPATPYHYAVLLDGEVVTSRPNPRFVTAPAPGTAGKLRFAFVSCVGARGYMAAASWGEMAARQNFDLVLMLGDNHYGNTVDLAKQRAEYTAHRSVAGFRELTAGVPTIGIWDDHDFGPNNSDGTLIGKEQSLRAFKEFWPNAAFGEPENPGCYHRFSRGDVDFFMLDVRYHRSPNKAPKDDPAKAMFGAKQVEWLKRELKASKAKVKFLAAGSEFQSNGTEDSWTSFPTERRTLLDFLKAEGGDGVIFLSGDRHFTAGYQVENRWIEVTSGPLGSGNAVPKPTSETWLTCTIGKMWSIFEIDTTGETPKVAYELWLAGFGLVERREFTWDEVNGRAKITMSPALPRGIERIQTPVKI